MGPTEKTTNEELNATEITDAVIVTETVQHPQEVPGMLAVDTLVKVNKSTIEGMVVGYNLSADFKTLSYLVDYEDEGEKHQRAFLPNQITKK